MRIINVLLMSLLICSAAVANDVTVDFDRVALLVPDQKDLNENSSRIALHFSLPKEIEGDSIRIHYAELWIPMDFSSEKIEGDQLLELQARRIKADWNEASVSWDSPCNLADDDIDTLEFFMSAIRLDKKEDVYMDVTTYVQDLVNNGADNFGLLLVPFNYDQKAFHFNEGIDAQLKSSAKLKIHYSQEPKEDEFIKDLLPEEPTEKPAGKPIEKSPAN
jgi:hypothetical protein